MQPKPISIKRTPPGRGRRPDPADLKGLPVGYVRVCAGMGYPLTSTLEPRPGEWILRTDDVLELVGDPPRPLETGELVVPRLERLIELLGNEAPSIVLNFYEGDYACIVFDGEGQNLANLVSRTPEESVMRALLFVRTERAANQ